MTKANPDPHRSEREVFLEVFEIQDKRKRAERLDELCGDDLELKERVEYLLRLDLDGSRFMGEGEQAVSPVASSSGVQWEPPSVEELDVLFGQYQIEAMIGRGGMGAVYRGVQNKLKRNIAIKILPPVFAEKPGFAARFEREALAMASLSHPNIITIHDFGGVEDSGEDGDPSSLYYFVMEYVEGTDLQQLIGSGGLAVDAALGVVGQICDALQYAHGKGFLHRDIKPANILVTSDGLAKVGDFGLAKIAGEQAGDVSGLTQTGYTPGTPHYMAPEMRSSDGKVDHRADIYSLGVTLYEMLTGSVPQGVFPPPSKTNRVKIDVRLDAVVLKALQSEPELRYQQASEVKLEIEKIDPESRHAKENRAKRLLTIGFVIISIIGIIVGGAAWLLPEILEDENARKTKVGGNAESKKQPIDYDEPTKGEQFPQPVGEHVNPDRVAAEWVLSKEGAEVAIGARRYSEIDALPAGKWQLTGISFLPPGSQITDEDLRHLAGLKRLTDFSILRSQLSGVGVQFLPADSLIDLNLDGSGITVENLISTF